jgi:LysR family transcriptional regulator, transcriptional activator of nhaA
LNPWINYHHLLYFKTIAEEGSVSKAAEKLSLGQPTLSAQLKQFEDNIGVQLFERQHKKLILSEQGRVALEYAKQIFKMGNEMYEVLQDRIVPTRTHVQIGALDSISKQITLQLTQAAYKVSPCTVSIMEGKPDELIRELTAHSLDLIVTNFLPLATQSKGLFHRRIIQKPIGIFAAPQYKSLKKNFPQSLAKAPFMLPTYDSKLRYDLENWFKSRQLEVEIIGETQDISLKIMMAVEGLGLIAVAGHSVTKQIQNGELMELGQLDGASEELYLVTAQRKIANSIAAELMSNFSL